MKAILYHEYGSPDVLHLEEVERPAVGDDEVLIKVHAASVNAKDLRLLRADPFLIRLMYGGFRKPKMKILGADIAGTVEAVGRNVSHFQPGDEVYGDVGDSGCGGFAEYVTAPEDVIASKPANITFEQAAALPMGAVSALQGLRDVGEIQAGQMVLINGASGGLGTFAVQIAKAFGAEVTGVCSTRNLELVRSLGADHVIDYTQEDFTRKGRSYDLIFAANGYHPLAHYKQALTPSGIYVMAGGTSGQLFEALLLGPPYSMRGEKKIRSLSAHPTRTDLLAVKELVEAGKITPVIDRSYTLSQVPDAFRYMENEHARGKLVITVAQATKQVEAEAAELVPA